MNKDLFQALEALCMMWEQYCGGKWGHECMSAGEEAEEVLDKWGLLIWVQGYESKINEEKLEYYRKLIQE